VSISFGYVLQLLVQECHSRFVFFLESLLFLPEMVEDQETVDVESTQLKKLMEWETRGQGLL